jgi:hypothetical protein
MAGEYASRPWRRRTVGAQLYLVFEGQIKALLGGH